jgi:hypothetical protein
LEEFGFVFMVFLSQGYETMLDKVQKMSEYLGPMFEGGKVIP